MKKIILFAFSAFLALLAGCGSSAQQGGAASSEAASTDTAASVSDGGEDNIEMK